jgi:glycosyltransferase involved in cell wall biosynthesis
VRILVASGTWYPERNGVARVATEVGQRLADRGHEVTALVPAAAEGATEEHDGSLTVHRVIRRGFLPLTLKDALESARHSRGLGSFDVVVAHGATAAVGLAGARLGAPLVLVYHASLPRELRFMRTRLPWGRERAVAYLNGPIATFGERAAVKRCRMVLILSEFSRSLLLADHPDQSSRIRKVPAGVDTSSFAPGTGQYAARERLGLDPQRRLLVTIRRAEPRMGIDQLLRAVRKLNSKQVDLAVVGGGPLTDELRRLSVTLGISERARFAGRVPEQELPDWYRAADLFVLPTVAYEGFGMATLEALASGAPVVGTPVGATPELLEPLDPRLVAGGSDPDSLAAAIRSALDFADDDFRARCRRYALARFDWDQVIGAWEDALERVVPD